VRKEKKMIKHMDEGKMTLAREIEKILKTGDISVSTLEKLHKLSDTYKNLCKIEALEESEGGYSEARGSRGRGRSSYDGSSSYDDDMMYSERRGRGRNAKRDSMGRYSSDGGSYERGAFYDDGYSRAKDDMMSMLGEMMEDASPKEREALKKCMRELERD
jgi:hypothetical protein